FSIISPSQAFLSPFMKLSPRKSQRPLRTPFLAFCEQGIFLRLFYIKKEHGFRGFFIRKQRTLEPKDSSVLIFTEIYLACFLLKTAVAIPLKKSRKKTTMFS
ncbi:hypothetical protein, partial [Anaerotignum sp.]|uniref:hypothetical protein n=1 Tax=Anaerotignum sp. TaxID=2039241 RepID=UPI0027B9F742